MFWVVDNFLMKKSRKLLSLSASKVTAPVKYINNKQHYKEGISDDEVQMHLMANEPNDTLIDDRLGSGSESEMLFRRTGSDSNFT